MWSGAQRPEEMSSVVEQVMRKMVGGPIAYDVVGSAPAASAIRSAPRRLPLGPMPHADRAQIRDSNKEALRTVSDVKVRPLPRPLACRGSREALTPVQAVVASVDFVLANAAKYDVEDGVLSTEVQQLGARLQLRAHAVPTCPLRRRVADPMT